MSEGRIALHGVAMETPAGYGMEMGEEQGEKGKGWETEKRRRRSPIGFLAFARQLAAANLFFSGFICTVQNFVSEPGNSAHCRAGSTGKRANVIPGNFVHALQSKSSVFPWKSSPNLLNPLPLSWGHLHPPQPVHGSFLAGCLGNT